MSSTSAGFFTKELLMISAAQGCDSDLITIMGTTPPAMIASTAPPAMRCIGAALCANLHGGSVWLTHSICDTQQRPSERHNARHFWW
jgi:hypothetical protein